jgi:hypothetical protein
MAVDILKDFKAGIATEETEDLLKLIHAFKNEHTDSPSGISPEKLKDLMTTLDRRLTQIAKRLQRLDAKMKFFQEIIPLLFKKTVIMNEHINTLQEVTKKSVKLKPGS